MYRNRIRLLVLTLGLCMAAPIAVRAADPLSAATVRLRAAEHHPAVARARADLEKAEALQTAEGAWPDPELEARLLWGADHKTDVEGSLRFALPWSGRLAATRRAAGLEVQLARLRLAVARHGAMVEAGRLLARLACSRSLTELHHELAQRSDEQAGLARQRQAANLADPLEVSLVLADAARDRRALVQSRSGERAIKARLLLLVGLPDDGTEIVTEPLSWSPPPLERADLLRLAGEQGPDLAAARLRMEQAGESADAAQRARVPDLLLGPALTRGGGESAWGVSVGIPLPIFGRTRGHWQAALAEERGAEAALDQARLALPVRINGLLDRLEALEEGLEQLSGEAAEATEQAFQLARARWTAGKLDVLHLLSAHRAFAEISIERLNTLLDLHETWLDLSLAVGRPLDNADLGAATETEP